MRKNLPVFPVLLLLESGLKNITFTAQKGRKIFKMFFIFSRRFLFRNFEVFIPPGKETSWRRRSDVFWYVSMTLQWRLKWNTQRRPSGTSTRCLTGTSPLCYRGTLWWPLNDTSLGSHIGTSLRRPKPVSNEIPSEVSVVRRQDVLEERRGDFFWKRNYDVTLVCPHDVSSKS